MSWEEVMRKILSSALILGLIVSPLPSFAGERRTTTVSTNTDATAGPIARAIAREAERLATLPSNQAGDTLWARVRGLESGKAILVTVRGSLSRKTLFVRADDSALTVTASKQAPEERIARGDVVEIRLPEGHPGRIGALVGAGIGAGLAFASVAGCHSGESVCAVKGGWVAMWGGIGAGAGAGIGSLVGSFHDRTQDVIYRAP